jgi:hypothetical protein
VNLMPAPTRRATHAEASADHAALESERALATVFGYIEAATRGDALERARAYLGVEFIDHDGARHRNATTLLELLAERHNRLSTAEWIIEQLLDVGGLILCQVTMTVPGDGDAHERGRETWIARVRGGCIIESWRAREGALADDPRVDELRV